MTLDTFLDALRPVPLVASVQAEPRSPLADSAHLARLALATAREGVRVFRAEGLDAIRAIGRETGGIVIGLLKRERSCSAPYITPGRAEVRALFETGCPVVALDGTPRPRPDGSSLAELIGEIRKAGRLVLADIDTPASARFALSCGADLVATTLAGYTEAAPATPGPDLEAVRGTVALGRPTIAEGRFSDPLDAKIALRLGACAVTVGTAIADPMGQTRRFLRALAPAEGPVGAVDLGGTWLRFGVFDAEGRLQGVDKIPTPETPEARLAWIGERARDCGVTRLGIGSGGTIDPETGCVTESKPIIPRHQGTDLRRAAPWLPLVALNDGLATAWGHARLPEFAGRRVATLTLGTGVGFGWVDGPRLILGPGGSYPRLNDLPCSVGGSVEQLLGGAALGERPDEMAQYGALAAATFAIQVVDELIHPDRIVICGAVGLQDWMWERLSAMSHPNGTMIVCRSPFEQEAGLYGAAALAIDPPPGVPVIPPSDPKR